MASIGPSPMQWPIRSTAPGRDARLTVSASAGWSDADPPTAAARLGDGDRTPATGAGSAAGSPLHLRAISVSSDRTHVHLIFDSQGAEHRHRAALHQAHDLRGLVITDELDAFLRPFLSTEPGLLKRLAVETWQHLDRETPMTPLRLA